MRSAESRGQRPSALLPTCWVTSQRLSSRRSASQALQSRCSPRSVWGGGRSGSAVAARRRETVRPDPQPFRGKGEPTTLPQTDESEARDEPPKDVYICRVTQMTGRRADSRQTFIVLAELLSDPSVGRYGYELTKATGLSSGTLYPILMRLEERGLLEACWEFSKRRPRHVYRLTTDGLAAARASRMAPAPRVSSKEAVA
jgi:PadR family transcriptional regulator PadR